MKLRLLAITAIAGLLALGSAEVQAQSLIESVPLEAEYQTSADEIISLALENPEKAQSTFKKFLRKIRTDEEQLVAAGVYFLNAPAGGYQFAKGCADQVYQLNSVYIPGLMLSAEVYEKSRNWGAAGQKYEEVLLIDPNYTPALRKQADVYKSVNPMVAKETLIKLKELDPTDYSASKDLGDIAYDMRDFNEAVAQYNDYYGHTATKDLNIASCENYVLALFSIEDYAKALEIIGKVEEVTDSNLIFKRMKFICLYESYDIYGAQEAMSYLNSGEFDDSLFIYRDYEYAAKLSKDFADFNAAKEYIQRGIAASPEQPDGYKELSSIYRQEKEYTEALPAYEHYLQMLGEKVTPADSFVLGQIHLEIAQKDTTDARIAHVASADSIFAYLSEAVPDSYLGPIWRARANNVIGATEPKDEVKELYEEAMRRLGDKEGVNSFRTEILGYIAWYYLQKDMNEQAYDYALQVLVIDENHRTAKQIKQFLEDYGGITPRAIPTSGAQ